jgi:hypothetical protein
MASSKDTPPAKQLLDLLLQKTREGKLWWAELPDGTNSVQFGKTLVEVGACYVAVQTLEGRVFYHGTAGYSDLVKAAQDSVRNRAEEALDAAFNFLETL